jgi:hypothetical protein
MHAKFTMIAYKVGSLSCFNNHLTHHADSMFIHICGNIGTSPCRSNIQSRPKGNEGLAALVGLAHASRAGRSLPRSGGILPRSSVGQDGSHGCQILTHGGVIPDCSSSLHARFFPMAPETYKSLPFRLFFFWGGHPAPLIIITLRQ